MNVPILTKRRERKQSELTAAIDAGVEKALTPAVAMAAQAGAHSGATYAVNPSSPFAQTGGFGSAYVPLPRPDDAFNSLFGSGYPLIPDPLDPLGPDGRAAPRRYQYRVSENLNLLDRQTPWYVLTQLASGCDVVSRCIELVQDALVGLEWSWGFSQQILTQIMHEQDITNQARANAYARDKYGDELQRVSSFFDYPDKRMGQTFSTWVTQFIWSMLTYDGVAIAPEYNLGGELVSLSQIDTPSIKILLDNQGFPPRPPAPAFQQILYGFPRGEFQAEDVTTDGQVPNGYARDQLAYYIHRPRPHTVYGFSAVEESINIATIYQARQQWLHAEYSHGIIPRLIIETAGSETWTPEQLGFYQQILNDQLSGQIQRRQQALLLRPGMTAVELAQIEKTYQAAYDEMLVLQIGAKFGVPQSLLGIQMKSSIGGGSQTKGQSDQSEQFATDALKNFIIDCINDLARRFMGVGPELTMTATGGGNDDDDLTRAQADEIDVNAGIRTRNEIRAERGVPLINEPEADALGVTIATGISFLTGALAQQQASASIAANMAASEAIPGQSKEKETGGDNGPEGDSDSGHESVSSGDGSSQEDAGGSAGSGAASPTGDKPSGPAPKDDTRQPDANAEKELAAFFKYAKSRLSDGKAWGRDFQFNSVGADLAGRLNAAGRRGNLGLVRTLCKQKNTDEAVIDYSGRVILPEPLQPGDKIVVEHKRGKDDEYELEDVEDLEKKASARSRRAEEQPQHDLHDKIIEFYSSKLAQALTPTGVAAAIAAAKKKYGATKKAAGDGSNLTPAQQAAADAVAANVKISQGQVKEILEQIYGDSYFAGSHAAATQIGGGARVTADLEAADAAANWSDWTPGWAEAANLTRLGGLQDLLDQAGVTIQSIEQTLMERLGNVIADGLSAGDSTDVMANNIADAVGGNADLIAITESARAMQAATMDTYQANDVDSWNWLAEDDACQICLDAVDDGPYDSNNPPDPDIPAHPRCRCAPVPVVDTETSPTDNADDFDGGDE